MLFFIGRMFHCFNSVFFFATSASSRKWLAFPKFSPRVTVFFVGRMFQCFNSVSFLSAIFFVADHLATSASSRKRLAFSNFSPDILLNNHIISLVEILDRSIMFNQTCSNVDIDDIEIIKFVEANDCLYTKQTRQYKNVDKKEIWSQIGAMLKNKATGKLK